MPDSPSPDLGRNEDSAFAGAYYPPCVHEILPIVDLQPSFSPPTWLIEKIAALAATMPSVATVERHDEMRVPFESQLGWRPAVDDDCLVAADHVFVKHGYLPPPDAIHHLASLAPERVLVCGVQADTCVLAAGFALFDAGRAPSHTDRRPNDRLLARPVRRPRRPAMEPPLRVRDRGSPNARRV